MSRRLPTSRHGRLAAVAVVAAAAAVAAYMMPGGHRSSRPRTAVEAGRTPTSTLRRGGVPVAGGRGVAPAPVTPWTSPTTASPSPACLALEGLTAAPLQTEIAQLLYIGVSDGAEARAALSGPAGAGGVFLSGPTGWIDGGVLQAIENGPAIRPFVAADEEGGRVMRIAEQYGPIPSAHQMASTMTPTQVQALAEQRGRDLLSLGITVDFAPDADLYDPNNPVINDRSFSSQPDKVAEYATAFAAGLEQAGVIPVIKHFPGHGRSTANTETGPAATPPWSILQHEDLVPFERLAGLVPAVMVGHLNVPGLTAPGVPASLSPAAMRLLGQIGFHGLVMTDDLSMGAITAIDSVPDAAVRAIAAGADMVLVTPTYLSEQSVVEQTLDAAVESGSLPRSRLDAALAAVVALKSRMLHCGGH